MSEQEEQEEEVQEAPAENSVSTDAPEGTIEELEDAIEDAKYSEQAKDLLDLDEVPEEVKKEFDKFEKKMAGEDPDPEEEQDADDENSGDTDETDEDGEVDEGSQESEESANAQATDTFDPALLLKAGKLGVSEEDVHACGNDGALRGLVKAIETRQDALGGQENISEEAVEEHKFEELILDPEEFDEDTIKLVGAFNEKTKAAFEQLAEQNAAMRSSIQMAEQETFVGQFESEVASLGDQWKPFYGEGKGEDRAQSSEELHNRITLFNEVQDLQERAANRGEKLDLATAVDKASKILFADRMAEIQRKEVQKSVQKRDKKTINRPKSAVDKKSKAKGEQGFDLFRADYEERTGEKVAPMTEMFEGLPD